MLMKTRELTGKALDWAVARVEGDQLPTGGVMTQTWPRYSCDWALAGPIMEIERISVYDRTIHADVSDHWCAEMMKVAGSVQGPTPLVAAMRCHLVGKVGLEIDLPQELVLEQLRAAPVAVHGNGGAV